MDHDDQDAPLDADADLTAALGDGSSLDDAYDTSHVLAYGADAYVLRDMTKSLRGPAYSVDLEVEPSPTSPAGGAHSCDSEVEFDSPASTAFSEDTSLDAASLAYCVDSDPSGYISVPSGARMASPSQGGRHSPTTSVPLEPHMFTNAYVPQLDSQEDAASPGERERMRSSMSNSYSSDFITIQETAGSPPSHGDRNVLLGDRSESRARGATRASSAAQGDVTQQPRASNTTSDPMAASYEVPDPHIALELRLSALQSDDTKRMLRMIIDSHSDVRELARAMARDDNLMRLLCSRLGILMPRSESHQASWNTRFQDLLLQRKDESIFTKLSQLGTDFVNCSSQYARVIISEIFVPHHRKTIKPVPSLGGVMGGSKYVCQGILFKCARDTENGAYGSEEAAQKSAGHELKSMASIYNCNIRGLHVPLMTLIDYRGFRLVCIALLPLSKNTIRYGSPDGGTTIHRSDDSLAEKVRTLGRLLNLRPHLVGRHVLCLAGDVEGHLGRDGKHYLVDLARLMPPEYQFGEKTDASTAPKTIWFKLLRHELVLSNPIPLCSDALSGWQARDPRARVYNRDVMEATQRLYEECVPACAQELDGVRFSIPREMEKYRVTDVLHRRGINARHLGRVRALCTNDVMRRILMTEMAARVIKCHLNAMLRERMMSLKIPLEEPYRELIVRMFNTVIGSRGQDSSDFWRNRIQQLLVTKFGDYGITEEESKPGFDFRAAIVCMRALFRRLFFFTGIVLSKRAKRELFRYPNPPAFSFVDPDIMQLNPRVKHANLIDHATASSLFARGMRILRLKSAENEALRLFNMANARFRAAASSSSTNASILMEWANLLLRLAMVWYGRVGQAAEPASAHDALSATSTPVSSRTSTPTQAAAPGAYTFATNTPKSPVDLTSPRSSQREQMFADSDDDGVTSITATLGDDDDADDVCMSDQWTSSATSPPRARDSSLASSVSTSPSTLLFGSPSVAPNVLSASDANVSLQEPDTPFWMSTPIRFKAPTVRYPDAYQRCSTYFRKSAAMFKQVMSLCPNNARQVHEKAMKLFEQARQDMRKCTLLQKSVVDPASLSTLSDKGGVIASERPSKSSRAGPCWQPCLSWCQQCFPWALYSTSQGHTCGTFLESACSRDDGHDEFVREPLSSPIQRWKSQCALAQLRLLLSGAFHMYDAILHLDEMQREGGFLFEAANVIRLCALYEAPIELKPAEAFYTAAVLYDQSFSVSIDYRFQLWQDVNVQPTASLMDRMALASLMCASEYSDTLRDDLVLVAKDMKTLQLGGCYQVTPRAVSGLAADHMSGLYGVDLSGCENISDSLVSSLCRLQAQTVEWLKLTGCRITDYGILELKQSSMALRSLDVGSCTGISDSSVEMLSTITSLQRLSLAYCHNVSERSMTEHIPRFHQLVYLDVSGIKTITYSIVRTTAHQCTELQLKHTTYPLHVCPTSAPDTAVVSRDGLSVRFEGREARMVRSNVPIPIDLEQFYFEMTVMEDGTEDCAVGIGVAPEGHSLTGMPGWFSGSFGYHGDDGSKFRGERFGQAERYGPRFQKGDVIGCLLDQQLHTISFTKNGTLLNVAYENVPCCTMYAVIGAVSPGAQVRVNMGVSPFRWQ